jgi:hypothetical protein
LFTSSEKNEKKFILARRTSHTGGRLCPHSRIQATQVRRRRGISRNQSKAPLWEATRAEASVYNPNGRVGETHFSRDSARDTLADSVGQTGGGVRLKGMKSDQRILREEVRRLREWAEGLRAEAVEMRLRAQKMVEQGPGLYPGVRRDAEGPMRTHDLSLLDRATRARQSARHVRAETVDAVARALRVRRRSQAISRQLATSNRNGQAGTEPRNSPPTGA